MNTNFWYPSAKRTGIFNLEKYRELVLDAAETVLGYFGFDRSLYGEEKNLSKRKWWWLDELRRERETDIKIEMSEKSKTTLF